MELVKWAEVLLKSLESSGPPPECTDVKAAKKRRAEMVRLLRSPDLMRELAELDRETRECECEMRIVMDGRRLRLVDKGMSQIAILQELNPEEKRQIADGHQEPLAPFLEQVLYAGADALGLRVKRVRERRR